MTRLRLIGLARFGLPGLVAGLALSWAFGGGRTVPARAGTAPPADLSGTIAFTTSSGAPGAPQLLYLIDTRNQSFAVYRVDPQNAKGAVKLEAARQYRWDLKLAEYSNQSPDVAAIRSMVEHARP